MKIDWTTDNAGQMLGFSYHDARLVELEWREERFFRMKLTTTDGGTSIIELCDPHMITLQAVWDGMIVSDIFAWHVANVPETVWDLNDGAWPVLLSGRVHRPEQRSAVAEIMMRKPSAFVVQVLSSYGGTFAVVCGSINVWTEAAAG
jgi:hypothetical protein